MEVLRRYPQACGPNPGAGHLKFCSSGGRFLKVHSVFLIRVSSPVDKDVDHPQFFDPPYPLKYLQAGLNQYPDVQVSLLDCWVHPKNVSEMVDQTLKIQPDLVVVSASSFDVDIANDYAAALKEQGESPLIVGIGQGYYLNGVPIKKFATKYDAILLGEPEHEFFRLFEQIRDAGGSAQIGRTITGTLYRRKTIQRGRP